VNRPDLSSISNRAVWLLLGYLHSNPDAKDTAEGIANWWLRARGINVDQRDVSEALNDLVARDWLIRRQNMSGYQIYGMNPARRMELQQLFKSK
jgi:hypothetical protein